jgi:DNA adenine methylase
MAFPGGKGRHYPRIIGLLPPHETYIEAFAGNAAVARKKRPSTRTILVDRDSAVIDRLRQWVPESWEIRCQDALSFLGHYSCNGSELVYCDPPYVRSSRRRQRNIYRHELDDAGHARLLDIIKSLRCRVVLSGYRSALYDKALSEWHLTSYSVHTRAGPAVECIWTNFDRPRELHDERFIGQDFRSRQDVQRRLGRIRRRLSLLSPSEQSAISSWLCDQIRRGHP